MEALQHGEMVVVTADAQWRLVGNPLICREILTSGSLGAMFWTSSGGVSVSLRFKLNKRETQKQKLFKMFFLWT